MEWSNTLINVNVTEILLNYLLIAKTQVSLQFDKKKSALMSLSLSVDINIM